MPDSPAAEPRPERTQWAPIAGRPTLNPEWETDAEFEAYIEALDLYESKD